ncbi:hypothetical protein SAMN05444266_105269 [Chitinophaga jiangningensis]|uniref:Outer membrane protein beta-barrel domain-containing protein n=1 Tax=Chitinophaga jiangningensis TaxID=1419482 RepID=A0A1M7E414_9BACT|nr:hypothetical protein [Chitinophaga jiangningensis]SHL86472.1 hypothetical protein SAMN05444266_105269 [Chitinophaga jiangningensis]
MKKTLLLICLLVSSVLTSFAQEDKRFHRNTYLKVNPTTLINELDIYLEQEISGKLSIELGISGIYTDYPDYVLTKKIDFGQKKPDISTEQFVDGRGLGFRAGVKLYLISRELAPARAAGTYFEPILLYKKVFYPNEDVTINGTGYTNNATKDVYGIQLLVGRQFRKDKLILDPFLGLGIRGKVYQYTTFHGVENNGVQINDGRLVSVLPSLHLGIKIGLNLAR